jgi:hypothetical protein
MGEGERARMREEDERKAGMGEKARSKLWGWQGSQKEDRTGMGEENIECKIDRDGREQGPIVIWDGGETLMDRQGNRE